VTVAKALEVLEHSNLIFRVRGSGTYVQHNAARGMVSLTIGYLVDDIKVLRNAPSGICLEAAHQCLEERGHSVRLLTRSEFLGHQEPAALVRRMVRAGGMNGLIISHSVGLDLLQSLGQTLPIVYIGNDMVPEVVLNLAVDFLLGYFQATRHLLELGHRRIGLLGGNATASIGYRAHQAFRLALQLAGVDPEACPVALCGFSPERYRPEIDRMLKAHPDLTGVVCADDVAAVTVIEAARDAGRCVPERLSVVGCNDLPLGTALQPALTTLRIDWAGLGRQSVDMLLGRIFGREGPSRCYIRPELIVRGSTAPPPG